MNTVFQSYHPAVVFSYVVSALVLCMATLHPVYVCLSLVGAFVCSCVTRGVRSSLRSLRWIVPVCCVIALANPLFASSGSSELIRLGSRVIYIESVWYGLCAGGMFAAMFLWFASYSACMTSENFMVLFGNAAPLIAFMVSQVLRLVPQFVKRGRAILAVQQAASSAAAHSSREKTKDYLRVVNVLMGWGMEDGLVRSQAMRARGYGCGVKRTTYKRIRFTRVDACMVGGIVVAALVNVWCLYQVMGQFTFYPVVQGLVFHKGFVCYGVFLALPVVLYVKEWVRWKLCA